MLVCSLLISFQPRLLSQSDSLIIAARPDSVITKDPIHSLFTGAGYGSNMIWLGSTISQDQPYGFGSITYGYKDAFYLSATAVHLHEREPFAAFWIGSMNYSHVFNSWFDISAGFYRYQVANQLTDTLFTSFNYGDITIGVDWKLIYTKLSLGTLFTSESKPYFQIRNSRFFQTPAFFRGKATISFDPYINLLFGPLTIIESSTDTIIITSFPFRKNGLGGRNSSGKTTTSTVTNLDYSTRFGIMEAAFGLPVSINLNKLTIEAEPGYILPLYKDSYFPASKGFVFMLSCYIRIL